MTQIINPSISHVLPEFGACLVWGDEEGAKWHTWISEHSHLPIVNKHTDTLRVYRTIGNQQSDYNGDKPRYWNMINEAISLVPNLREQITQRIAERENMRRANDERDRQAEHAIAVEQNADELYQACCDALRMLQERDIPQTSDIRETLSKAITSVDDFKQLIR